MYAKAALFRNYFLERPVLGLDFRVVSGMMSELSFYFLDAGFSS